jgi:hypothetical protein
MTVRQGDGFRLQSWGNGLSYELTFIENGLSVFVRRRRNTFQC